MDQKIRKIKKDLNEKKVEFIDLKSLDLRGKLHSLILPKKMFDADLLKNGVGFDASSYGFAKPEKSDMVMIPDLNTMFIDPFSEKKTAVFLSNVHLTDTKRTRFSQDVRFIAEKAEKVLKDLKIGTRGMFGPEFEFFIFKDAEYYVKDSSSYYYLEKDSEYNRNYYHSSSPDDDYIDFKNEAVSIMENLGIEIKYHHHEVAVNQHEIETKFNTLLKTADASVIIKYILFSLAKKHDLFLTFMPKPLNNTAGNGWHVHQWVVKNDKNIFFEKGKYGNFSDKGLNYISGLLFHSGSLCAFTNPSTNSYKRLVRGFEAPVSAVFAKSNRNAAIRIPTYVQDDETRMEYRPGDASSNPYLFLSSMLLAGIDGISKDIEPGRFGFGPFDSGIPDIKSIRKKIKMLPESLSEALNYLARDNDYLKINNIFTDELISQWIKIKRKEIDDVRYTPNPREFEQYFGF